MLNISKGGAVLPIFYSKNSYYEFFTLVAPNEVSTLPHICIRKNHKIIVNIKNELA